MARKKEVKKEVNINKNANGNNNTKIKIYKVDGAAQKEEERKIRDKTIQKVMVVIIVVLAIAAIFSGIMTFFPNLFGRFTLGGELAATVNGKGITMTELNNEYARLPAQYQYYITKDAYLQQLIDQNLLADEAARNNFSVTDKEIDGGLLAFMQTNNLTQDNITQILKAKKLTMPELRDLMKNQLLVNKVLSELVDKKINITTEQALKYFNDNPSTFTIPEMVTVRHILISIGLNNRTVADADKIASDVLKMLNSNKSNFCGLVAKYSDDSGSAGACGEYTFARGQMVAEFENRSFDQAPGAVSIVDTQFGSHILWTVNKTAKQIVPFKDVQQQITQVLFQQQEKIVYANLIASLRAKATIVDYLAQKEAAVNKTFAEQNQNPTSAAQSGGQIQVNVAEPAQAGANANAANAAATAGAQTTVEVTNEVNETNETKEPAEATGVEETPAVVVQEQPITNTVQIGFADCLANQGAVLYGAYWDSSTKTQESYFGADIGKITYVECGVQGDYRAQTDACKNEGILAYPTWIINSKKYMGIQELAQLATISGCKV